MEIINELQHRLKNIENYIEERFLEKIDKREDNECWNWIGAIAGRGYGYIKYNNKLEYSHRVSFLIYKGEISNGMYVLHKCNNILCVNPNHLYLGTQKENMKQMYNELRDNRKLSFEKANEIRKMYDDGRTTQDKLAKKFRVSRGDIESVVRNEIWINEDYTPSNNAYNIESSYFSKLTWKDVDEIREEYSKKKILQKELAKKYCVSRDTISDIVHNRTWNINKKFVKI